MRGAIGIIIITIIMIMIIIIMIIIITIIIITLIIITIIRRIRRTFRSRACQPISIRSS